MIRARSKMKENKTRCAWVPDDALYIDYHDKEWGVPLYDDQKLFELLILEGMQAGLSWHTVLKKRENYRNALDHFDANKMAQYDSAKIEALLNNPGIIRHRLKVESIVSNAKAYLAIKKEYASFADYIWLFVGGTPIQNDRKPNTPSPASTDISDSMSKALKNRGFKFVGSTICYAFMQASGMVNDHSLDCFCFNEGRVLL